MDEITINITRFELAQMFAFMSMVSHEIGPALLLMDYSVDYAVDAQEYATKICDRLKAALKGAGADG